MIKYAANATITKAKAMYGRRLTDAGYKELAAKKTVSEAAEYLKKSTHFSEALSTLNTASVRRGHLETVLRKYNFDRFMQLCSFQDLGKTKFYDYQIVLSEILEILSVILHINGGRMDEYITAFPSYLISRTSFDLFEISKVRSMKELISVLRHTPYYQVLSQEADSEDGKADYLRCELLLRTYYFKWLTEVVNRDFSGNTRTELLRQIEIQIDFINLINAYRMKKYYGLSVEEIEKHSLPFYGKLNQKKRYAIFSADNAEDFIAAVSKSVYGSKISYEGQDDFETAINRLRSAQARRALMFSDNPALSIYSFGYLMEVELSNVITVIEGIRYSKKPDYLLSRIVLT